MGTRNRFIGILLLLWRIVSGEIQNGCLIYDFESDLEEFRHDASICEPFPLWTVGNYSDIGIERPNSVSESFISPAVTLSCISSLTFQVSGGVVEINIYMDGQSPLDVLQALLMMSSPGDNDITVVTGALSPSLESGNGWHSLKLQVPDGFGNFEGYITFIGSKSDDSIFLVDSYRYVPQTIDESTCPIYEETNTTPDTTEKPNDVKDGQCVTYNFEKDFDVLFTPDNYLCDGFLHWTINNYTLMESPDTKSNLFISPSEAISCITSFVFTMEPNGVIEANVYMEPKSGLDYIIVIAQKVTSGEVDTVAGSKMYYPEARQFVAGWNVLSFTVVDFNSFDGYLVFLGSAVKGSTVLIDSVRYIPPSKSTSDESCSLY